MTLSDDLIVEIFDTLASVEHAWRVAGDRSFHTSREWDVYFAIVRELGLSNFLTSELALGWLKSGNPHYIDLAICHASENGDERSATLDGLMLEVAALRSNGATRQGGPFRIRRAMAKNTAFAVMALFKICADATLEGASSKAAQWLSEFAPMSACKASLLHKDYPGHWGRKITAPHAFSSPMSKEDFLRETLAERFDSMPHPGGRPTVYEKWAAAYRALPFATEEVLGFRH